MRLCLDRTTENLSPESRRRRMWGLQRHRLTLFPWIYDDLGNRKHAQPWDWVALKLLADQAPA
jgi:hypothetical protein